MTTLQRKSIQLRRDQLLDFAIEPNAHERDYRNFYATVLGALSLALISDSLADLVTLVKTNSAPQPTPVASTPENLVNEERFPFI